MQTNKNNKFTIRRSTVVPQKLQPVQKTVPKIENEQQKKLEQEVESLKQLNYQSDKKLKFIQEENQQLQQELRKREKEINYFVDKIDAQNKEIKQQKDLIVKLRGKKKDYKKKYLEGQQRQEPHDPFQQLLEMRALLLQMRLTAQILPLFQQQNRLREYQTQVIDVDHMTYEQILQLEEQMGYVFVVIRTVSNGIAREDIRRIPKRRIQESDNIQGICPVCQCNMEVGEKYRKLGCNHYYHAKCIKSWLLTHNNCPVCKQTVILHFIQSLFLIRKSPISIQLRYLVYNIRECQVKILWSQGFPMSDLLYLSMYQKSNYVTIEGAHVFMNNTVRFDLQLLNHIAFGEIDIFLVCSQQDVCLLNHLTRLKQFKPQIICTQAAYQLGQHYIQELYNLAEARNRHFHSLPENYSKEDESFRIFEDTYHTNFQEFTEVFPPKEIDCTLVNYGQITKIPLLQVSESLNIEAQPSGTGIGESAFILSLGDYFKLIVAPSLNNTNHSQVQKWASEKLKIADYMICGIPQQRINYQFINQTYELLQYGLNVVIPFNSFQMLLNLQDEIDDHLQHRCHKIFIISREFHNYILIANSLVESLNKKLQSAILKENPQNPFNKLLFLIKQQKIIVSNSVEELKFEGFSLVETLKGTTPSVFFLFDSSLRLGQSLFLFDLLEQVGQQSNIYTQQVSSNNLTFGLQLIDPDFYDERLLYQIKEKYKFKLLQAPLLEDKEFVPWSDSQIKTLLIPEGHHLQCESLVLQYKLLQKIQLKLNQIVVPMKTKLLGQGKKILGNIEMSNALFAIEGQEAKITKSLPSEVNYIMGKISDQTIRRIGEEVSRELCLYCNTNQKLEFVNSDNEICAIVEVLQNECKVFAKTNEHIARIQEIVYRCLNLRKL